MDTSDVNTLHLLHNQKKQLVNELRNINKQIKELQEQIEKTCEHQLLKERSYDGHRYQIFYRCTLCKTYIDDHEKYPIVDERYTY